MIEFDPKLSPLKQVASWRRKFEEDGRPEHVCSSAVFRGETITIAFCGICGKEMKVEE